MSRLYHTLGLATALTIASPVFGDELVSVDECREENKSRGRILMCIPSLLLFIRTYNESDNNGHYDTKVSEKEFVDDKVKKRWPHGALCTVAEVEAVKDQLSPEEYEENLASARAREESGFLYCMEEAVMEKSIDYLRSQFSLYDINSDGFICRLDDINGDWKITLEDKTLYKAQQSQQL